MGISKASLAFVFILSAANGLCQTPEAPPLDCDKYYISFIEIVDPAASVYLDFFRQVTQLGCVPLSGESKTSIDLSADERQSLFALTEDLAVQSRVITKALQSLVFEARLQAADSDTVAPALKDKIRALTDGWSRTILDRAERLRSSFGDARFLALDEFVHSGKPLFIDTSNRPKKL